MHSRIAVATVDQVAQLNRCCICVLAVGGREMAIIGYRPSMPVNYARGTSREVTAGVKRKPDNVPIHRRSRASFKGRARYGPCKKLKSWTGRMMDTNKRIKTRLGSKEEESSESVFFSRTVWTEPFFALTSVPRIYIHIPLGSSEALR